MRKFVSGFVACVAWMTGACLPVSALIIDDFEEGPFSLQTAAPSGETVVIAGLSTQHVVGGSRQVSLRAPGSASLRLGAGDDGVVVWDVIDDARSTVVLQLTYANLAGVDLTSGGSETTLFLAISGPVSVTIDGQTQSTSSGSIPLSSFDQIDPTRVDEITVELLVTHGTRTLFDVRTVSPAEALTQCQADLGESNLALYEAELALAQCVSARPFADADGDGEDDSTDRCAGTPTGAAVDGDGCSQAEFCAARAATCRRNDWLNDEPTRKKPGDCVYDKEARTCG